MLQNLAAVPAELRDHVQRWWERASAQPRWSDIYAVLSPAHKDQLPVVIAASEFVESVLIQDPGALEWFGLNAEPTAAGAANADYEARAVAAATVEASQQILREWRRREMLRIAWRDIAATAGVTETLQAVSELADACIRAATGAARLHLMPLFGLPRDANGSESAFIVIGMGKLGGRELNFSSDIDLVFLFTAPGQTDGRRTAENEEYFTRLGRDVIRLLDVRNADGFVFRVDMRLRPYGDSGPLVVSLGSLEDYLQQHGRDWERYAWIKARAVVGQEAYAAAYQEFVRPFVYRRYLDFGVFESLRGMKALIEREVARRDLEHHLKLGKGGIREIEFIVQSMQLVRGGNDRRLQTPSLLSVLPLLSESKLLAAEDVADLGADYLTLRKFENALQILRDQQVHTLPDSELDRARLCLIAGYRSWSDAGERIEFTRTRVARHFDALLFGAPDEQRRFDDVGISWLDSDSAKVDDELANFGFPSADISAVAAGVYR